MTQRFERINRQLHLTVRDLRTIEAVFEARYLTNRMVQRLFYTPTTASACRQRLRYLFDAGYLRKHRAYPNEPDIYFLGLMMEITLPTARNLFVTTKQTEARSARTLRWYRMNLEHFATYLDHGSPQKVSELTVDHARGFVGSLRDRNLSYQDHNRRPEASGGLSHYTGTATCVRLAIPYNRKRAENHRALGLIVVTKLTALKKGRADSRFLAKRLQSDGGTD